MDPFLGFDGRAGFVRDRLFLGSSALLFIGSVAITIYACRSMRGGMTMPGNWTMSMAWMAMRGQSRVAAAIAFMEMWIVMMAAMMLPVLVPALMRYRRSLQDTTGANALSFWAGAGYFFVWALLGLAVYPLGVLTAQAAMASTMVARSIPIATAAILLMAGALQLTPWKVRQLCRCRAKAPPVRSEQNPLGAWLHGISLGIDCALCCSGLMTTLVVTGVMDLTIMVIITLAITAERILPAGPRITRWAGFGIVAAGVFLFIRALGATAGR